MKGLLSQGVMYAVNKRHELRIPKELYKSIKTDHRKEARFKYTIYKRNPRVINI